MNVQERAEAVARAEQGIRNLHENPRTTLAQLGAARDQLNIAHNFRDAWPVWAAVYAIEAIVLDVYGTPPTIN